MKYPPGFTPKEGTDVVGMHMKESNNIVNMSDHNTEEVNNTFSGNCTKKNSKEDVSNSVRSGHFKTSMVPCTCGSILSLMDELVKVGQVMGYKMDGCMSNMTEIIESQGVNEMENMDLFSVKMCWGNFTFDYVHNDSVGEVVIMGDFNEVRYKSDRFGSVFIVQGANVFNSFITNAGLEEVPLGGSSFTWCHKSATKMSKLDIFLISENLLNTCLNITAITLERYLSDHRPILLHESHFDYGPTPFRFFHQRIEMEGFSKFMEERRGKARNVLSAKNVKAKYKDELEALEAISDKGDGNVEVVNKRMEVVNTLQKIDKICSSKIAQKAKVELESDVSNEEIKREVWDCRIDKSPGPDVFTFGFYRRFWNLIENDVYDAVKDDGKVRGYVKYGAKYCWLSIVNEINSLKNKGINLLDFMHVKLGNGDKTAFWEDIWIEGKALKNRYPRIYSLETCNMITMGMELTQTSLDSLFRRVPRGGVDSYEDSYEDWFNWFV
nr:RNA-directed DNA polymerase, eukaryota [Tanacetum cinerariifolium]